MPAPSAHTALLREVAVEPIRGCAPVCGRSDRGGGRGRRAPRTPRHLPRARPTPWGSRRGSGRSRRGERSTGAGAARCPHRPPVPGGPPPRDPGVRTPPIAGRAPIHRARTRRLSNGAGQHGTAGRSCCLAARHRPQCAPCWRAGAPRWPRSGSGVPGRGACDVERRAPLAGAPAPRAAVVLKALRARHQGLRSVRACRVPSRQTGRSSWSGWRRRSARPCPPLRGLGPTGSSPTSSSPARPRASCHASSARTGRGCSSTPGATAGP